MVFSVMVVFMVTALKFSPHDSSEGNLPMSCGSAWAILKNRRQCPFGSSLTQEYEKIGNALF